jgi:hypothetical protein
LGYQWFFYPPPRKFFLTSDELILYSIDPEHTDNPQVEKFHKNPVLGKATISDPAEKACIVNTLFDSFYDTDLRAACFFPHHGLRAIRRGKVMDLEICFFCGDIYIYKDGKQIGDQPIKGDAKAISNQSLRVHHLPMPKDR